MDITLLFKACVKTIRTRNKALGVSLPELDKNRILNCHTLKQSDFIVKSKDIICQITRLRDFLLEHRRAYLNFSSHLSNQPTLADSERDKIDTGAHRVIKQTSNLILDLKRNVAVHEGSPQLMEHQEAVLDLLDSYLKAVCKIYSEQKAIRMKRNLEVQKMARLESDVSLKSESKQFNGDLSFTKTDSSSSGEESNKKMSKISVETASLSSLTQEEELTAEELQIFESENEQLYNDLNSLTDEVRQIESKVVHIAELQEVFTEKVLVQEKDIERIYGTVVGTTENLRDANTQIRQAIQSNAGMRVYVLFFLLVMSLTLLFLDWYND